ATPNLDYQSITGIVHFASGQTEATLDVIPKADDLVEGDETVVAEIINPPTGSAVAHYIISPDRRRAVVTITDEDTLPPLPLVSIEATSPITSEPLPNALVTPGLFTIRRSGPTDTAFTLWIYFGGTAGNGVDYERLPNTIQFS